MNKSILFSLALAFFFSLTATVTQAQSQKLERAQAAYVEANEAYSEAVEWAKKNVPEVSQAFATYQKALIVYGENPSDEMLFEAQDALQKRYSELLNAVPKVARAKKEFFQASKEAARLASEN